MRKTDLYLISFALTVVLACFMWILAFVVYRNNRKEYLNRTLSLAMGFMGLWMLSGFIETVVENPSETLVVWTFRWAYASGIMACALLILFTLALYLDRPPKKTVFYTVLSIGIASALLSFTPFVIRSASFENATLKSQNGPLFPVVASWITLTLICSIYFVSVKWYKSTGIDRLRTSIVLCSMVIYFPFLAVCVFLLPYFVGNDTSITYAFLGSVIPVAATSYAIIRLRLLDVRIILRRTGVIALGTILLSIPVALLFLLFQLVNLNPLLERALTLIAFAFLFIIAPSVWRYIRNLSSGLFFSELYDELHLLDAISHDLAADDDPQSCILTSLSEIIAPLGIKRLAIVIPPGVVHDSSWNFECSLESDASITKELDDDYRYMEWLNDVDRTVITEELQRWPKGTSDTRLAKNLALFDLSACIPINVRNELVGYYLVGEKAAGRALSSTDISLLEKSGDRLGLFLDNYALSVRLGTQLQELMRVYQELQEAYDFKSEIIEVTSHEFRTPVTIVSGFTQTLITGWNELDETQKLSFLNDISEACDRITSLTEQFLSVTELRDGRPDFRRKPARLGDILQPLCSSLSQEEQSRVMMNADPQLYVLADSEHLRVILRNVLENALRFSDEDKPVHIKAWNTSTNSFIQIQDCGNGIPSKEREKIFEPFVRLENLDHHSRGVGLGLYIVRLLSSKTGVEVEIESTEGVGTTVTLVIGLNYDYVHSPAEGSHPEGRRSAK